MIFRFYWKPKLKLGFKTELPVSIYRPVRRILKRGVQSTAWPLGHGEGEGGGCVPSCAKREAFTLDDLEWQIFIQIYREKLQKQ